MTEADIQSIRIVPRSTHWDRRNFHEAAHPFVDVFIVAKGRHYYTRLFHTLDDSPHARAAQVQDFLRRAARYGYH